MTAAGKRVPPHDAEAERGVLGIAMLDAEALGLAMDMLSPEVFYLPAHAEIFRHMADMFVSSQVVDQVTVLGRLNDIGRVGAVGGAVYLAGLTNQIPSVSAVAQYCKRLHGLWIVRRLIAHCSEVIEQAYAGVPVDELMDLAEGGMFGLSGEKSAGARKLSELIDESIELLDKRSKADGGVLGVSTGFVDLDVKLAGLEGGNLYILAGRPSMGKTALAMNIVQHAAIQGNVPALVYSMEMSGQQLAERMLSGCANVS
ncbi:MAG: DnaB-like helicase C-terminal domain-containing protein, partial [Desulfofustis sp.]|nr:DnaB-like helicase C-terminal domain-containing protein [Desulfofustis sp.]